LFKGGGRGTALRMQLAISRNATGPSTIQVPQRMRDAPKRPNGQVLNPSRPTLAYRALFLAPARAARARSLARGRWPRGAR
jgi:hypothetical protein